MRSVLIVIALILCGTPTYAHEDQTVIEYVRQGSLELPGLTACHICEWRPQLNNMPAPQQCGTDAAGDPLVGLFACGYSQDCQRVCNFLDSEDG